MTVRTIDEIKAEIDVTNQRLAFVNGGLSRLLPVALRSVHGLFRTVGIGYY